MTRLTAVLVSIALAIAAGHAAAAAPSPPDNAIALVHAPSSSAISYGTAWCYACRPDADYWISCSHVVRDADPTRLGLTRWVDGAQTPLVAAHLCYLTARFDDIDVAVLSTQPCPDPRLAPTPLNISRIDSSINNERIATIGCPAAQWPSLVTGRLMRPGDATIATTPEPLQGRSGSPILDVEGRVLGLLTWQDDQSHQAISQSWPAVARHLAAAAGHAATSDTAVPHDLSDPPGIRPALWIEMPFVVEAANPKTAACPGPDCPTQGRPGLRRQPPPRSPAPPAAPATPTDRWPAPAIEPQPPQPQPARPPADAPATRPHILPILPQEPPQPAETQPPPPADQVADQPRTGPLRRALRAAESLSDPAAPAITEWHDTNNQINQVKWVAIAIAVVTFLLKVLTWYQTSTIAQWSNALRPTPTDSPQPSPTRQPGSSTPTTPT